MYSHLPLLKGVKWIFMAVGGHIVYAHELSWFTKISECDKSFLITYLSVLSEKKKLVQLIIINTGD